VGCEEVAGDVLVRLKGSLEDSQRTKVAEFEWSVVGVSTSEGGAEGADAVSTTVNSKYARPDPKGLRRAN